MRVGYLTGEYPRATDTFIQREVAGLRLADVQVDTFAVRRSPESALVGPEQRAEHERTTYLLAAGPLAIAIAHVRLLLSRPDRWRAVAFLAWQTRQPGVRGALLQLAYFAEAGLLARLARARRLEHLHNHFGDSSGSVTMLAAALAGLPYSLTVHGPDIFADTGRWCLDIKAERASFVICISQFAKSQVMTVAPMHTWERLHIVHCGVNPALYPEPSPEPGRFRLLAVGRLHQVKGLPVLLEAVGRLRATVPGLMLDVVGDGPHRAELEALVTRLGIGDLVTFHGALDQAAVRRALLSANVLVSPSFAEGLPVVLMEALASRTPVVATRIMGVPELVEDQVNGHLVPPADVDALVAAVQDMARRTPQERRAMGERGRLVVERSFDADVEAAALARLFRHYGSLSAPVGRSAASGGQSS